MQDADGNECNECITYLYLIPPKGMGTLSMKGTVPALTSNSDTS